MLDTNELFFNNGIDITFVEPYPELLLTLIKKTDRERTTLISSNLQEVDLKLFAQLEEHDIVFVDSTHVSKVYSDVNYIFFKLLPSLRSGVLYIFTTFSILLNILKSGSMRIEHGMRRTYSGLFSNITSPSVL